MTNAKEPTLSVEGVADASPAPAAPQTPSQQIIRASMQPETLEYVKDSGGKGTLGVRRPGPLAEYRIVEAVGPALSSNQAYMQMINPLIYLESLDGVPEPMPSSKLEIEALLMRLGHAGQERLGMWHFEKVISPMMQAMNDVEKAARERDAVKN